MLPNEIVTQIDKRQMLNKNVKDSVHYYTEAAKFFVEEEGDHANEVRHLLLVHFSLCLFLLFSWKCFEAASSSQFSWTGKSILIVRLSAK